MIYTLSGPGSKIQGKINLTSSKSESNRLLIIQALCDQPFEIKNLAAATDTQALRNILLQDKRRTAAIPTYNVGPAGTTMRFLTAYFSIVPGVRILTGSERMKQRPVRVLVDALRQLGAEIEYLEKEGYPPLKITGKPLKEKEVRIDAGISSQYITALLLIAPALPHGIAIHYTNKVTSHPYINMTLKIMEQFGVSGHWHGNTISVSKQPYLVDKDNRVYHVEADWSSASYWYSAAALAEQADIILTGLKKESLQGDAIVVELFNFFGVHTQYTKNGIRLTRSRLMAKNFAYDFSDCPDIAQTMAVVAAALGVPSLFNGLHTLIIKETDRISALINELTRLGATAVRAGEASLRIGPGEGLKTQKVVIKTYEDHRMAMSFAPLAIRLPGISIEDPEVVKKSYPGFWNDMEALGFTVKSYEHEHRIQ